ncbi:hypothetical protein SDC9_45729 [bioreactor metagenome]|uniref:Uncharacterized protein n=1 Tax=bioreactor metagenome TaxID=1076179 RepID=A0A644W701_9ZZZZ
MQSRSEDPDETAKIQPLQKRGCDKNMKDHFNLTISDTDKKTFAAFTKKYPNPRTSKVILALIREHMKRGTPGNA